MRTELERIIHQQAQDFINQTVAEKEAKIRLEFEQQLEQRLASQSVALVNNVNVDMTEEPSESFGNTTIDTSSFGQVKMGTRRKPTDIGRVPNVIRNRSSLDNSMDGSQFGN